MHSASLHMNFAADDTFYVFLIVSIKICLFGVFFTFSDVIRCCDQFFNELLIPGVQLFEASSL